MAKKKLKCSIAIIGILILIFTICYLSMGKNEMLASFVNKTKSMFAPNTDDGSITYSTAGNESANYEDGDMSGERTQWVKNGDTWTYTFYVDDPNAEWYVYEDSSTLMEGYTGDHTEYNADKLFTEETLDSFSPTENMTVTQNSNGNNVYTWLDSENSYKVIDNGDGTFKKVTTRLSLTVTNYKASDNAMDPTEPVRYGELTINKIVKNSQGTVLDESEDQTNFVFTITLTADDSHKGLVQGTKVYGETVFKDGVGTVSLKAGGTKTITGIPAGLAYSVVERDVPGYTKTCESTYYGTIDEETPGVVTYINTQVPRQTSGGAGSQGGSSGEDTYTDLTIKKVVTGNSETEESYDIEVALDNLKPDATYTLSDGTSFTADSTGSADLTVILGNNEEVTIQNIPVGSKYKVYEHAGDYISSYVITDSNNVGSIVNSANANTKVNTALSTATETADEGEDVTITFTNKKVITQNLKIEKVVTNDEDTNSYLFEIQFANMEENTSFNSTVGKITADNNGKADLTIYLAGGENAEFYEVPVGTTYIVKELASGSIASYSIVDSNGGSNVVSSSNANTAARKPLSTEIETVNQGEEVIVTFTNDTVNQEPDSVSASVGASKTVTKPDGSVIEDCDEEFIFEITAVEEGNPMPENSTVTVTGNGDASFGTITFDSTGTYTYKVVEKSGNNEDYKYDDSEYIIVYEVTNPEGLLEVTKSVKKNGFDAGAITFTNILSRFNVAIFKADEEQSAVYGATLQIIDSEDNVIKEWVVSRDEINPFMIRLATGTYILHEVEAPRGYELADDIEFVVNDDGSVSVDDEVVVVVIMKDPKVEEDEPDNKDNEKEETATEETEKPEESKPAKPEKQSPQTGDKVMIIMLILVVAGVVMALTFRRNSKH